MDDQADLLLLIVVARPCPDCTDERLFVPADADQADGGEYCCTWCGAALLIDPASIPVKTAAARDVANRDLAQRDLTQSDVA
jgi:hypothetical protein